MGKPAIIRDCLYFHPTGVSLINGFEELTTQLGSHWAQPQRDKLLDELQTDEELRAAFTQALKQPVGFYPPFSKSVFAGDTVAVVLQKGLLKPRVILETLLGSLLDTSVEPTDVTVVVSPATAHHFGLEFTPKSQLAEESDEEAETPIYHPLENEFQAIQFLIHDASDDQGVAYIAASEEGLPVKVNRAIVDADVIIPIGTPNPIDRDGLHDCIYPDFCNTETQARFSDSKRNVAERKAEIQVASDHLGAFSLIQFVTGPGAKLLRAISGERMATKDRAESESATAWQVTPVEQADMAIVSIETDPFQQCWEDFAQAVINANLAANSSGPIFVWSELSQKPRSEVKKALNQSFESREQTKLSNLMKQLAGIAAERQIFLKSKLSRNVTEDLGLGYVENVDDLKRLIDDQPSGVVLRDAHLCDLVTEMENQDA